MTKKKKKIFFFALLYVLSIAAVYLYHQLHRPRPNVIVFMVDTLRADFLSVYGFPGESTPFLKEFAKESIVFDRARSQAAWTKPSVASFFTSLYVPAHRIRSKEKRRWETKKVSFVTEVISPDLVMMAESFQQAGYQTAAFVTNLWVKAKWGFNQGFDVFVEPTKDVDNGYVLWKKSKYHLPLLKKKKPVFLYYHFMDPHYPYECPDDYFAKFRNNPFFGQNVPLTERLKKKRDKELNRLESTSPSMNPDIVNDWKACYVAGIRKFDDRFKKVIGEMKELGLLDNAIVIFTSDHGEAFLEHGYWAHGKNLHGTLINVPLLIRMPKGRHGGTRVSDLVDLIDIFPTLASYLGFEQDLSFLQGRDVSPYLQGKSMTPLEWSHSSGAYDGRINSVESEKDKMIWVMPTKDYSVYDLEKDPKELKNVAEKRPERVKTMKSLIRNLIEVSFNKLTIEEKTAPISEEELEKLRSLGYLQ